MSNQPTTTKKTKTKRANKRLSELLLNKPTWCDYAEKGMTPKYIIHRFDDKQGNRFYYFKCDDKVVIAVGVTTAFGQVSTEREAINRWKDKHPNWKHLLDVSSEFGTLEHILFGKILLKQGVDKTILEAMKKIALDNNQSADMPVKDVLAFLKFQEDYKLTPLLIEAQLAYQCPRTGEWLCLTVDLLAKMEVPVTTKTMVQDGVYSRGERKGEPKMVEQKETVMKEMVLLGDLKSNFFEKEDKSYYETHKMQLIAGARAIEQNFGIKVDGIFNISPSAWRTAPNYTFFEHDITEEDNVTFEAYWNLIVAKKINVPKGSLLITDSFKDSNDYKFVSYQEYAEQALNTTV